MSLKKILNREMEVAFSKHSQPVWFRIAKYIVLGLVLYFFWGNRYLWIILGVLLVLALVLHFWYRYKTRAWTQSYGLWKYDKDTHEGEQL